MQNRPRAVLRLISRYSIMSDEGTGKKKKKNYYMRHRSVILRAMSKKYKENEEYREATLQRAKDRYHEDESYRLATIERAKERYRRLRDGEGA